MSDSQAGTPLTLFWADPSGHAADDYDLYVFDSDGNVVAFSQDRQDGNDDPYERLDLPTVNGLRVALRMNPVTIRTQSARKNTSNASAVATCSATMNAR